MTRSSSSLPVVDVERAGLQAETLDEELVEPVVHEAQRHLVDAELLVALLDDRLAFDVAEQGDLVVVLAADRMLGAADEDVRLDTDLPQPPTECCVGLVFSSPAAFR